MKQLSVILLFLLSTTALYSQTSLSLEECVRIAIENNLTLQQNTINIEKAESNLEQSKLAKLPNVNASTSHSLNLGRSLDFTTYEFSNQALQSNNAGVSAGVTLFNGGRIKNNVALQRLYVESGATNLQTAKENIAIEVAARYLDVLLNKERKKVAENTLALREIDLERTNKLIENGVSPGSIRYDIDAQVANTTFQVLQADNGLQRSLLLLKQVMNVPLDTELELSIPDIDIPTRAYLNLLTPDVVYAAALLNLGSIKSASKAEEIASLNIKMAEAQRYPSVSANAGLNSYHSSQGTQLDQVQIINNVPVPNLITSGGDVIIQNQIEVPVLKDSPLFKQFKDNFSQSIGIGVSIPIFNNGQVKNAVRQAELDLQNAKINTSIEERALEQRIQNAWLDAELAYRQYEAATAQQAAQEKALEFAQKRYSIGSGSQYDYFTAQNNANTAALQVTQAKYDFIYKVKILEFYKENNFTL